MRKGCVQVYTGNGKGKTTAALGLALRAAGAGRRVFIAQFIKKALCSEHMALDRYGDLIIISRFGTGFLRGRQHTGPEVKAAQKGLAAVARIIASGEYDVVIMDEINVATHAGLVSVESLVEIIDNRPPGVEIVLTGRNADRRVIRKADLVTEMKEIKHYMNKGVRARKGIEF
jgi:cob(I)alamin adenosyltransferase